MQVLEETHSAGKDSVKVRWISTDSIEKYVIRNRGKAFRLPDRPLYLTERIRQAARRLVAIPGRGGKTWQAIALEENTNQKQVKAGKQWVRRMYAPNRGNIVLGLVKADTSLIRENMMEVESFDAPKKKAPLLAQEMAVRIIDGRILQNLPEWKGRYWLDDSGRIRSSWDKRRPRYGRMATQRPGEQEVGPLDAATAKMHRWQFTTKPSKGSSWKDLLAQNKSVVDRLTSQRIRRFGLDR
jgi:hypothetical protein